MDTVQRIVDLIKKRKMSEKEFLEAIGANKSALSDWKSKKTESYTKYLNKITEVLKTSTDYLLCKTDDPTQPFTVMQDNLIIPLSPAETKKLDETRKVIQTIQGLDSDQIHLIGVLAEAMKKQREPKK